MCKKGVSKESLMLNCYLKSQESQKALSALVPALKFAPDQLVTNKKLKKLDDILIMSWRMQILC